MNNETTPKAIREHIQFFQESKLSVDRNDDSSKTKNNLDSEFRSKKLSMAFRKSSNSW